MTTTLKPVQQSASWTGTAAAIGLAGVALSIVAWAMMLGNPAQESTLWYAASTIGEIAMIGTLVLVLGLFGARETGPGATGRGFLALWALALVALLAGGVASLLGGDHDSILFPVGGITSTVAALVSAIFIACNKRLAGSPRRWAPLVYAIGTDITGFFQGDQHTLRVNLADLTDNLLLLLLAGAFFVGVRKR